MIRLMRKQLLNMAEALSTMRGSPLWLARGRLR